MKLPRSYCYIMLWSHHVALIQILSISFLVFACVANAEEHDLWSLCRPTRPEPPAIRSLKHAEQVRNGIDQFLLKRLEDAELQPAPEANRRTLVRRACFDLLGLPPSLEQVDTFVNDKSPDAWQRLIDSLLESKHYGERWGRHWLDVARYADSGGYETDIYYRSAWRYRDYVVKSFNDDKPYNTFVQEQIAGDELWPDNLDLDPRRVYIVPKSKLRNFEARTGTGFYTLGPRVHESALDARRLAYEQMTDWVDTTASAFMGLTLGCSRCHDHKFDPFTQIILRCKRSLRAPARWNCRCGMTWGSTIGVSRIRVCWRCSKLAKRIAYSKPTILAIFRPNSRLANKNSSRRLAKPCWHCPNKLRGQRERLRTTR